MTERSNNNTQRESCQQYLARISAKGYQSPLVADDLPLTLTDNLPSSFNAFYEASPPAEVWVERLKEALKAQARIAESLETQPDYSDLFQELIKLWEETNRLLRDKQGGKDAGN